MLSPSVPVVDSSFVSENGGPTERVRTASIKKYVSKLDQSSFHSGGKCSVIVGVPAFVNACFTLWTPSPAPMAVIDGLTNTPIVSPDVPTALTVYCTRLPCCNREPADV